MSWLEITISHNQVALVFNHSGLNLYELLGRAHFFLKHSETQFPVSHILLFCSSLTNIKCHPFHPLGVQNFCNSLDALCFHAHTYWACTMAHYVKYISYISSKSSYVQGVFVPQAVHASDNLTLINCRIRCPIILAYMMRWNCT